MKRVLFAIMFLWVALVRTEGQTNLPTNLPAMTQLPWFGVGTSVPITITNAVNINSNCYAWDPGFELAYYPQWGIGAMRDFFNWHYGGFCNQNEEDTNGYSFAWSKIQLLGSNDWEWGNADAEMAWLTNFNTQIGVVWPSWGSKEDNAYCTNGCSANGPQCMLWGDPPWASSLTTAQYAIAKGNFISNFVARYSTPAWRHVVNGVTNGLTYVEPENEPFPYIPNTGIPNTNSIEMHIAILKAAQGARTNGVQLIGWVSWAPDTNSLANYISFGLTNWVDGVAWHYYTFSDIDPSRSDALAGYSDTNDLRADQFMNYLHTRVPSNFTCHVDELGMEYSDPQLITNSPTSVITTNWITLDPMRLAKEIIMLRAGGAEMNLFCLSPALYTPMYDGQGPSSGWTNYNISVELPGRTAIYTASWIQNLPFSGLVSNGNALAYSFGSGSNEVTLAWTYEGTTQIVTTAGYSEAVDLYSNSVDTVSVLTSDITVLLGPGTITFPKNIGRGEAVSDAPVAAFSATPTYGSAPMVVTFTDSSAGAITNHSWRFGDGFVTNAAELTVVHRYTMPGSNTVQLIVSGPSGASTNTQYDMVIVPPPINGGGGNGFPPGAGDTTGGNTGGTNSVQSADGRANNNWRFLITY
jgi:PKD repeat protein